MQPAALQRGGGRGGGRRGQEESQKKKVKILAESFDIVVLDPPTAGLYKLEFSCPLVPGLFYALLGVRTQRSFYTQMTS
jgi:hypothetical protein